MFQSLIGRLQTATQPATRHNISSFQSLIGRLQTNKITYFTFKTYRFNPSQVGYKRSLPPTSWATYSCFNPSQVGYKLYDGSALPKVKYSFNPSQVGYKLLPNCSSVNLILVSIPHRQATNLPVSSPTPPINPCFNPSQVGYKPCNHECTYLTMSSFNPSQVGYKHGGSALGSSTFISFQSLIGRLQTPFEAVFLTVTFHVSIPHRQATNTTSPRASANLTPVSIPHRQATNLFVFVLSIFIIPVSIPHRQATN